MAKIKLNKYVSVAYIYFFFNGLGLAGGLLLTNLLTPFFYVWLVLKKKEPVILPCLLFLLPFSLIHILNGVETYSFLLSTALFLSTYICVATFNYFINNYSKIEYVFKKIVITNFVFVLFACLFFFTPYREWFWYINKFTKSVEGFPRLALLTYEASYYSLLFAPIAIYYLLKIFFELNKMPSIYILILTLLPLLLSLSIGVLGSLFISFLFLFLMNWKKVLYKKNFFNVLFFGLAIFFLVGLFLYIFFPNNVVFIRLNNILEGTDSSTRGRTTDSFAMAWMVAEERSIWFGSGLGQIKILAFDIVKKYFNYWGEIEVVRIPNAVAETLAIFGIFGLVFRFALLFYFFFKTKVLTNYYRTCLFVFVFVYQFTGSYITNIVEYVIWILAFSNVFKQFDKNNLIKKRG